MQKIRTSNKQFLKKNCEHTNGKTCRADFIVKTSMFGMGPIVYLATFGALTMRYPHLSDVNLLLIAEFNAKVTGSLKMRLGT